MAASEENSAVDFVEGKPFRFVPGQSQKKYAIIRNHPGGHGFWGFRSVEDAVGHESSIPLEEVQRRREWRK